MKCLTAFAYTSKKEYPMKKPMYRDDLPFSSERNARTEDAGNLQDVRQRQVWGLNLGGPAAGVFVDEIAAINLTTVYACVSLRAQMLASLPVGCFRKLPNDDREAVDQHPAHWIFNKTPDEMISSFNATEASEGHVLLRGNSFFELIRNNRGQAMEAYLLDPRSMSVLIDQEKGTGLHVPRYEYSEGRGTPIKYDRSEVLHFANLSNNGLVGTAPLTMFRESMGMSVAANRYAAEFFAKGGYPLGFLTRKGAVHKTERETFREEWDYMHGGGPHNSHRVALLTGEMSWQSVGMNNADAQLLGLRQFQKYELASLYRVPPFLIGDVEQPLSDTEFIFLQFAIFTMLPTVKRREGQMNMKVFTKDERHKYYMEHNMDAMLRGTFKERQESFQIMARNGALIIDEWRRKENLPNLPDGLGKVPMIMASQTATIEDVINGNVDLGTAAGSTKSKKNEKQEATVNRIAKAYEALDEKDRQLVKDMCLSMNGKGTLADVTNR
jgi:HK97 family phage portal protein